MKKIKWALIGCGKVVLKNKTTPFINHHNTIISICTTSLEHSKKAIEKLNLKNCNGYDDVYKMLDNELIDAIYICTPPKFHFEYLNILSKYNIPIIYVEKPFVLNEQQCKQIIDKYQDSSTEIFVAHYKRLTPQIKKLKQLIIKKKFGEIFSIEGEFFRIFDNNLLNTWLFNKKISGGGRFFDISPHILDCIYYVFGEFSNINSEIIFSKKFNSCESKLITTFNINDIKCSLKFDFDSNFDKDIICIYCSKGIIKTSINRDSTIYIYNDNKIIKKIKFSKTKIWGQEAVNNIDKIFYKQKYDKDIATLDDAYTIQKYIDEILKKGD